MLLQAKEQELKARLVKQQEEFREQREAEEKPSAAKEAAGPLPAGWQEVADPSGSGDVYYWNKVGGAWVIPQGLLCRC